MGFSRQEYWSGLLFPFPGNLPDPGIGPESPELQASALPSEPPGKPRSVKKRVVKEDEKKKRHVGSSRAESQYCKQNLSSPFLPWLLLLWGTIPTFPDSSAGKESTCNAGDPSSIPGWGRSTREGIGYLLQYSGLENSMDGIVHRVTGWHNWLTFTRSQLC